MSSTSTTDPRPLPEIEHEFDALLVRYAGLEAARRRTVDILERVHAGDEVDAVLTRMGELQAAIAAAPASDIADAAVKLRRLAASLSLRRGLYERRLVTSALAAVEAAAVTVPGKPQDADIAPRVVGWQSQPSRLLSGVLRPPRIHATLARCRTQPAPSGNGPAASRA